MSKNIEFLRATAELALMANQVYPQNPVIGTGAAIIVFASTVLLQISKAKDHPTGRSGQVNHGPS